MIVKGKEYPHKYPPIISQSLFEQVQQVKEGFIKKPARYGGLPFIYRGLIRCAHCGLAITAERQKGIIYYHYTQYNGKHGAKWLREDEITEQLGQVFKNLQMPAEVLERITGTLDHVHQNKIEFHNREFDKLTNEQKTLTKMMDNLYLDKLKDASATVNMTATLNPLKIRGQTSTSGWHDSKKPKIITILLQNIYWNWLIVPTNYS